MRGAGLMRPSALGARPTAGRGGDARRDVVVAAAVVVIARRHSDRRGRLGRLAVALGAMTTACSLCSLISQSFPAPVRAVPEPNRFLCDRLVRWLGITPLLKPRGTDDSGSGLGKTRYVVERTLHWFNNFRRLRLYYEKTPEHFQAFHELAAALICAKRLLC
jgi:hypothetical protein